MCTLYEVYMGVVHRCLALLIGDDELTCAYTSPVHIHACGTVGIIAAVMEWYEKDVIEGKRMM